MKGCHVGLNTQLIAVPGDMALPNHLSSEWLDEHESEICYLAEWRKDYVLHRWFTAKVEHASTLDHEGSGCRIVRQVLEELLEVVRTIRTCTKTEAEILFPGAWGSGHLPDEDYLDSIEGSLTDALAHRDITNFYYIAS